MREPIINSLHKRVRNIELTVLTGILTYLVFRTLVYSLKHVPANQTYQVLFFVFVLALGFLLGIFYGLSMSYLLAIILSNTDELSVSAIKHWKLIAETVYIVLAIIFLLVLFLIYLPESLVGWGAMVTLTGAVFGSIYKLHKKLWK